MSFLPAVRRAIDDPNTSGAVRAALVYLLDQQAIGRANRLSITNLTNHLQSLGFELEYKDVQQQVIGNSRHAGDFFIGSNSRGIFLIDSIDDAQEMVNFYASKIRTQQENLGRLINAANRIGWALTPPE